MTDFLRVFEGKALAEELTRAGHSVSEKTVQRWKSGVTKPKPQDIRAIRELVGATLPDTKKEASATAEAIASVFLERWSKAQEPEWALKLTEHIIGEIRSLQGTSMEAAATAALDRATEQERVRLHPDEQTPDTSDQSSGTAEGSTGRRSQSAASGREA